MQLPNPERILDWEPTVTLNLHRVCLYQPGCYCRMCVLYFRSLEPDIDVLTLLVVIIITSIIIARAGATCVWRSLT